MTDEGTGVTLLGNREHLLRTIDRTRSPLRFVGTVSPLTARLAEEAGLDGCWLSSLELSATYDLPDRNLLGLAEVAEVARRLRTATTLPLFVDGENGYGTVEATIRAITEFAAAGVTGVALDDNDFPKTNSFDIKYDGERRLRTPRAFADQIAAAASTGSDVLIVARTEILIVGGSIEDALHRLSLCAAAGADFGIVHTRDVTGRTALEVGNRWSGMPLVCIPTAFPQINVDELAAAGYRIVVYANQVLRAQVAATRRTLRIVVEDPGRLATDPSIIPMNELVGLTDSSLASRMQPSTSIYGITP